MSSQFNHKRVFAAACTGMLLFGMVIITLGSILPSLITKFQLDEVKAGTLTSLLPSGILAGSIFFGPIVDRHSYKYLLITCSLMIIIGLEGIAFTENLLMLQLFIVLIGLGGGAINGGTNALVADISFSSTGKQSANLSLLGVFFGMGALGMPFLLGLLSEDYDSYHIIAIVGLVLLLPVIYFSQIRFPQPKQSQHIPLSNSLDLLKDRNLILLGFILFFQSGLEGVINNWSTLFLQTERSFVPHQALFGLTLFVLSLTLTRIVLSYLLKRLRPYKILLASALISVTGIISLMSRTFPHGEIVGLVLLGSGLAAGFPVILGYVGTLYPKLSGTAFSMVLVIALGGNILINFLVGLISKVQGIGIYTLMLLVCAFFMILMLIITLKRISNKTQI